MKIIKLGLLALACGLFFSACTETKPTTTTSNANQPAANANQTATTAGTPAAAPDMTAETKKVYTQSCANCHKEDGSGGKVTIEGKTISAEDLRTEKMKRMSDAKYIEYIEKGVPDEGMPAFKGKLTDEQIKNLVAYIRTEFQK